MLQNTRECQVFFCFTEEFFIWGCRKDVRVMDIEKQLLFQ